MGRPTAVVRTVAFVVSGAYSALLLAAGLGLPQWARYVVSLLPTLAVAGAIVWDLWLWRLLFVQSLVRRPDLRGLWQATLAPHPDSKIPDEVADEPVEAFLEITQTYWSVHTRMYTAESASWSTAVTWLPSLESVVDNLTYVYENKPKAAFSHRSARSTGSCTLLPASLKPVEMEGSYFTDRYAKGDIQLRFVDRSKGHATFERAREHLVQVSPR